jgi:hypothetical protein
MNPFSNSRALWAVCLFSLRDTIALAGIPKGKHGLDLSNCPGRGSPRARRAERSPTYGTLRGRASFGATPIGSTGHPPGRCSSKTRNSPTLSIRPAYPSFAPPSSLRFICFASMRSILKLLTIVRRMVTSKIAGGQYPKRLSSETAINKLTSTIPNMIRVTAGVFLFQNLAILTPIYVTLWRSVDFQAALLAPVSMT